MALDQDTIVRLMVREHDRLYAYTWSIARDDHLVEDVLQEVAIVALRKRREINDEQHFMAWSRITCRNTAMDLIRKQKRRATPVDESILDLLDGQWEQLDESSTSDLAEALRHCVAKLSPYAKQIIDLRYTEGLRSSKLAERLNRNVTTIYVALTRIHRKLGECIERELATGQ